MSELKEEMRTTAPPALTLDDFVADQPTWKLRAAPAPLSVPNLVDGVGLRSLARHSDGRGWLSELLTTRDAPIEPIVHVYHVMTAPGSIRGWVYHRQQQDRLAFTTGDFEVVLYDLRPESPSFGALNVLRIGKQQPVLLSIPTFVVHGVKNVGLTWAAFTNLPTKAYDPAAPDKFRLPWDDPRVPHSFR